MKKKKPTAQKGVRKNEGKTPLHLISTLAKHGLAKVLGWAAEEKYDSWNYAKGIDIAETFDCLERHLDLLKEGHIYEEESGLPLIDFVQANAHMASHLFHAGQWDELTGQLQFNFTAFEDE